MTKQAQMPKSARYPSSIRRVGSRLGFLILLSTALIAVTTPIAGAESVAARDFEDENWADGLVDLRGIDLIRTNIVGKGFLGKALEVNIPTGGFRGFGPFDRLPLPEPIEAWYRYYIRATDWNSVSSGKLPGLSGIYSSSGKGCIPSTPTNPGWSARQLFGAAGTEGAPAGYVPIGFYIYHLDQPGLCGEKFYWPDAQLEPGRWHCVEGRVRLNDLGQSNGRVDGWFDGNAAFSKTGMSFRRPGEDGIGIRELWLNIYFGGKFSTPNDLSMIVDEFEVSTNGRVACLDPFLDDNTSIHESALIELHAVGHLYGCNYRQSCPKQRLTRGEAAALFSRVFGLPTSSDDHFDDDNGNTFEPGINKVAAAGIVFGCGPSLFCPERLVTRAEYAAMAIRALDLPLSSSDVFTDDNGHWAEQAINALAEAGITHGCAANLFCPDQTLTREEAAAFFVRILGVFDPGALSPQSGLSSGWPPGGPPPPIPEDERE